MDEPSLFDDTDYLLEKLNEEKQRLLKLINDINDEIDLIKSQHPYNKKEFLNDTGKIETEKNKIKKVISEIKKIIQTYEERIKEMLR